MEKVYLAGLFLLENRYCPAILLYFRPEKGIYHCSFRGKFELTQMGYSDSWSHKEVYGQAGKKYPDTFVVIDHGMTKNYFHYLWNVSGSQLYVQMIP